MKNRETNCNQEKKPFEQVKSFAELIFELIENKKIPKIQEIENHPYYMDYIKNKPFKDPPEDINDFHERLERLKDVSYLKSMSKGSASIQYTLRKFLGIPHNFSPKWWDFQLKACRESSNIISLFAKTPRLTGGSTNEFIKNYGLWDEARDQYSLYQTINALSPNARGWRLRIDKNFSTLDILHEEDVVAIYQLNELKRLLESKLQKILLINALRKKQESVEYFFYYKAEKFENPIFEKFLKLIENGSITLNFRMHLKGGKMRDHGTGFRIQRNELSELFSIEKQLL